MDSVEETVSKGTSFIEGLLAQFTWDGFWSVVITIFSAFLVVFVGFKLIKFVSKKLDKSARIEKLDKGAVTFIRSLVNILARIGVIICAAAILGLPMSAVVASVGSIGLAIGLAIQGSLSNFAGGVMLLIFKPFKVGDIIKTDGEVGVVAAMNLFYTTLDSAVKGRIVVPNSKVSGGNIENYSLLPALRVDMDFTASYSDDPEKVRAAMLRAANRCDVVLPDPPPIAQMASHADSALVYTLRFWISVKDQFTIGYGLPELVKEEFDRDGIEIPFPQIDVHQKTE